MTDEDDERYAQVRGALLKGVLVLVVIAVVIAVGSTVLVRSLGLGGDSSSEAGGDSPAPTAPSPLPSTALPSPEDSATPSGSPSESDGSATPSESAQPGGARGFVLEVSPVTAAPMERVNLTGTFRGADDVQLAVQRRENGTWSDFGVTAPARVGTFATYVMTSRVGENRFRMLDPASGKTSNVVRVTIQ